MKKYVEVWLLEAVTAKYPPPLSPTEDRAPEWLALEATMNAFDIITIGDLIEKLPPEEANCFHREAAAAAKLTPESLSAQRP
jgi:hypothetical protein